MKYRSTLVVAVMAAAPVYASEEQRIAAATNASVHAESARIVVTASRAEETIGDALAPITVVTREQIERLQTRDLQDLFVGLPGLNLATNGGPGKSASLFVRGTESDHVLVLIDGIKVGSATTGSAPFEQIPVDQVERIEIVRGPRSSLYGSEAIGGVIQIFTRRGEGDGAVPSFSAGRGTRGDSHLEAGLRGGLGDLWYALGVSGRHTDGINARPSVNEPDKDGYERRAGSARLGYRFGEAAEVWGSYWLANGENEFDGSFQNQSDTRTQVLGLHGRLRPLSRWKINLSAGQSRDESDNFLNGTFTGNFDTRRGQLSLINEVLIAPDHRVALGGDHQMDEVESSTAYAISERDNTGAFLQYRGMVNIHEFQASIRSDDNEQFGRHETGGVAYGIRVADVVRAGLSYGTAFKAPTFNELYFPGFGNDRLEPEASESYELSLASLHSPVWWQLNAFQTQIEDLIAFDASISAPVNVATAKIQGVEAQFGTRWKGVRVATYLTWLRPEDDSGGASDGNTLPRRRERSGRIDLDYDWKALSMGLTLTAAARGYDDLSNSRDLPGYGLLNLRAAVQVMPDWQLQLVGTNVLDKTYETAATYPNYGGSFMATVRYTPAL